MVDGSACNRSIVLVSHQNSGMKMICMVLDYSCLPYTNIRQKCTYNVHLVPRYKYRVQSAGYLCEYSLGR